jgi:microcystin-dependent protein
MAEPFLSEIRIMSFNFAPKGWATCDGQFLPINQNQALFSLLGTTYGGNGQTTFALPDLRGRSPFHVGNGHTLGERGGEAAHTLNQSEMAAHNHRAACDNTGGLLSVATKVINPQAHNTWAASTQNPYKAPEAGVPDAAMNPASISATGGSQPHENMQPYNTLNFCIALQGIFPSRN